MEPCVIRTKLGKVTEECGTLTGLICRRCSRRVCGRHLTRYHCILDTEACDDIVNGRMSQQIADQEPKTCPDCGNTVVHAEGGITCPVCGYSTVVAKPKVRQGRRRRSPIR